MNKDGAIFSKQIERHGLGGLIQHPKIFSDIDRFIEEKDFYTDLHSTIFCVIRSIISNNKEIDKVLISEKITNLGITFEQPIDIYRYVDDISATQIEPSAVVEASKELLKYRIRREIMESALDIADYTRKCGTNSIDEIISTCDKMYSDRMRGYNFDDEPVKLFEGLVELIEERGNNPQEETGLLTPYEEFNDAYGGLRPGNLYSICSRSGQGKTTWINDICCKTASLNSVKALMLDTEMETEDIKFRMAAAATGVNSWYLETGNWRKNSELVTRVRAGLKTVDEDSEVYHAAIGNKTIDEICSIVRRWYLTYVGRGNPCVVAYDYIKLTGEKVSQNWAEHQAIGEKTDKLKKLSEEINAPIIVAMQANRAGEGDSPVDDASVISLSDRVQWFVSFSAIFRRKTREEMARDNEFDENGNIVRDYGTHKLVPVKTRFQGRNAAGHQDLVRRTLDNGTVIYEDNCLYFNVRNFSVEERGSLRGLVRDREEVFLDENPSQNDGEIDV